MDLELLTRTAMIVPTNQVDAIEALDWLAPCWDPRGEDLKAETFEDITPCGLMRETNEGVQSKLHPVALLAAEPLLWGTVSRWNAGQRELTRDDYDRLSKFELAAKVAMVAAANRKAYGGRE